MSFNRAKNVNIYCNNQTASVRKGTESQTFLAKIAGYEKRPGDFVTKNILSFTNALKPPPLPKKLLPGPIREILVGKSKKHSLVCHGIHTLIMNSKKHKVV